MPELSKFKIWMLASRPKTLWAAASPVLVGTVLAFSENQIHWFSAIVVLFCALTLQIGANFANDYFDHQKGSDTSERIGPMRVTQAGLVTPQQIKNAFLVVFALTLPAGIYLIIRGGYPIVIIGVLAIGAALLYTGGPYPLGYHGFGELLVLLFFGPVAVGGTYYLQTMQIQTMVILIGIALGLLSAAILIVNNFRDVVFDKKSGKKTLTVYLGTYFSVWEYMFCFGVASILPIVIYTQTRQHAFSMIASIVIVLAWPNFRKMLLFYKAPENHGNELNTILAQTGKLLFIYSVLFSIGWLI